MTTTFVPSTTVTVLGDPRAPVAENAYGDEVDDTTEVASGLPATWTEKDQRTQEPASGRWTIVEGFEVRLRPGTAITEDQRLRNERTGEIGQVVRVIRSANGLIASDVVVRLRKISR